LKPQFKIVSEIKSPLRGAFKSCAVCCVTMYGFNESIRSDISLAH